MDVKKSTGGPPFSQRWADLLGCAYGSVYWAVWADLGSRGGS
jgi:hypothetical protein